MWLQVWVCRSYLLLCVVSMIFPVNHHNFLELINFFFLAQQCQLWLSPALAFTAGGITFIFCCSSLQNHVYHEKVKETTKGRKQDVSCKIVCVNLHSIVLQLERSSQSKNTVKLVYQIASLIFFFKKKKKTWKWEGMAIVWLKKQFPHRDEKELQRSASLSPTVNTAQSMSNWWESHMNN